MAAKPGMTYAGSGVRYVVLDLFKRMAQLAASATNSNIRRFGISVHEPSRGESAFLIRNGDHYLGHVEEGLGTKNLAADALDELLGGSVSHYALIAQDTVAMIVNDMITVGALPIAVAMHLAVGDDSWFSNRERTQALIEGWKKACDLSGCVWSGGETPTLKGIILPGTATLSGSAIGRTMGEKIIEPSAIKAGDAIIIAQSSGIHANGLTLARDIATRTDSFWKKIGNLFLPDRFPLRALPKGYLTELDDGRTYGETLLDPTHIYVPMIEACLRAGIDIHYAVNITGHGWRKLMRAPQPFGYIIDTMPDELPIFRFILERGPVSLEEAYGNLNMGAGFAIYIAECDVARFLALAEISKWPFKVFRAGHIEAGKKRVVILPKKLEYQAETLAVR